MRRKPPPSPIPSRFFSNTLRIVFSTLLRCKKDPVSPDDIACWFIDTNYNQKSFFVRHAYFTGGNEPYDRLKRALRAEIDEDAWATLYSTTSRPFPKPDTDRIAIKVINHYGDEAMKVYEV